MRRGQGRRLRPWRACASARAALAGGATWLAVAGLDEARELPSAEVYEAPLLVMGPLQRDDLEEAVVLGVEHGGLARGSPELDRVAGRGHRAQARACT